MNKDQFIYQWSRFNNGDYSSPLVIGMLASGGIYASFTGDFFFGGAGSLALAGFFGYKERTKIATGYALQFGPKNIVSNKEINSNKDKYPLEHVDSVRIDDNQGLEELLLITSLYQGKEWGTVLKAYEKNGTAIITDILFPREAKEKGLVGNETETSMTIDAHETQKEGFNGFQHYHPTLDYFSARNYTVSSVDRLKIPNWINLLTFDMPDGPEIIAFNRQHTYIPTDKTKKVLVKATPKEIYQYLSS